METYNISLKLTDDEMYLLVGVLSEYKHKCRTTATERDNFRLTESLYNKIRKEIKENETHNLTSKHLDANLLRLLKGRKAMKWTLGVLTIRPLRFIYIAVISAIGVYVYDWWFIVFAIFLSATNDRG